MPRWLQALLPVPPGREAKYIFEDDDLPPLEDISPYKNTRKHMILKESYNFDPVLGVIPSDCYNLWKEQAIEREQLQRQKIEENKKKILPPVRFIG